MKKNTKRVMKSISITEYKNFEKYLEKKASEGLMLSEIKRNSLIFERTTPKELTFNISLFYYITPFDYPDEEKDKDYRKLHEERGWIFCASNSIYQIFYKEKDAEAIPMNTDPSEEYRTIKSIFMKTDFVSMLLMLFIVAMHLIQTLNFNYETLFSDTTLFIVISPVLLIAIVLSLYTHPVIWLIKNKRNVSSGKELTFSTEKARLIRNIVMWSFVSVYFILIILAGSDCFTNPLKVILAFIPVISGGLIGKYFVKRFKTEKNTRKYNIVLFLIITTCTIIITMGLVMAIVFSRMEFEENNDMPKNVAVLELSDFGTNATPKRTRTYEQSSIFVPLNIEYYESLGRKAKDHEIMMVSTTYIECRNKDIAEYIFDGYMNEEKERREKRIKEYLAFENEKRAKEEENEIIKISNNLWNVDRGYYLYNNKSEIIIQKEEVIYILESDVDFSEKEIVDICKEKLEL
ncbi:DUF2812 domain-containing protein [Lutibacter sp. B2]|nr:DUF2812 domain-containing protein [Lutibacter sp. B2]